MARTFSMQSFVDEFAEDVYGTSATQALEQQVCVSCGSEAVTFRDSMSAREYQISALCQKCQDETFGVD